MQVIEISEKYFSTKHQNIVCLKNMQTIKTDYKYYIPCKIRSNTIWIDKRFLEKARGLDAVIVAVGNEIVEIPAKTIEPDKEFNGIRVKVVDEVRIKISRETRERLRQIASDPDEVIRRLLEAHSLEPPAEELPAEALAFRACLFIAKRNLAKHILLMRHLLDEDLKFDELTNEEKRIVRELASHRLVYIDNRHDGDYVKLVCYFELHRNLNKVTFWMGYKKDFCRHYCDSFGKCSEYKKLSNGRYRFRGFKTEFDVKEWGSKSIREMSPKWRECVFGFSHQ